MTEFERGFIMLCTNGTEKECLERNLFGDIAQKFQYLCEIRTGDIGLLLNVSKDELIGVFKALFETQLHIEPRAWNGRFPAQVRVESLGKLQRVNDAAFILKKIGIKMTEVPSGAPVPQFPVHEWKIFKEVLAYFKWPISDRDVCHEE